MSISRKLEIRFEDRNPHKWCIPLKEDVLSSFIGKGDTIMNKVFGDGSFFSPFLFGKFFDPCDAFPVWEFDANVLLSGVRSSDLNIVDWLQTTSDYFLRAEVPGLGINGIQVCVDDEKVVEISSEWRQLGDSKTKDWKCNTWWEHGYVRRLELPANADWTKMEAHLLNDKLLEIKIPKAVQD